MSGLPFPFPFYPTYQSDQGCSQALFSIRTSRASIYAYIAATPTLPAASILLLNQFIASLDQLLLVVGCNGSACDASICALLTALGITLSGLLTALNAGTITPAALPTILAPGLTAISNIVALLQRRDDNCSCERKYCRQDERYDDYY